MGAPATEDEGRDPGDGRIQGRLRLCTSNSTRTAAPSAPSGRRLLFQPPPSLLSEETEPRPLSVADTAREMDLQTAVGVACFNGGGPVEPAAAQKKGASLLVR